MDGLRRKLTPKQYWQNYWDKKAQEHGYDSLRQYLVINYYLPDPMPSLVKVAADIGMDELTIARYMRRYRLPSKEKGWPTPHKGFYCQECEQLRPLTNMRNNFDKTKVVCSKCAEIEVKGV